MKRAEWTIRLLLINLVAFALAACGGDEESPAGASADGPSTSTTPIGTSTSRVNAAPTISGSPPLAVKAGSLYQFRPTAADPDGDPLTYTIANRPPWAAFDRTSGRLQGIPGTADTGTYGNIKITVTDGKSSAQLSAFKIVVADPNGTVTSSPPPEEPAGNAAPTISGSPPTSVLVGNVYAFTPGASDPDGDTLTFTIANKPAWASFSSTTGRLRGTPTAEHVGTYSNIEIRVSDGSATNALPAFAVTVTAVASGSATLSWAAPTQNEDGTPLTDLAGFKVHWGTARGSYTNTVTLDNPGITSYVVDNLVSGTYYFVTSAFNSAGIQSNYSNEASKTIP